MPGAPLECLSPKNVREDRDAIGHGGSSETEDKTRATKRLVVQAFDEWRRTLTALEAINMRRLTSALWILREIEAQSLTQGEPIRAFVRRHYCFAPAKPVQDDNAMRKDVSKRIMDMSPMTKEWRRL